MQVVRYNPDAWFATDTLPQEFSVLGQGLAFRERIYLYPKLGPAWSLEGPAWELLASGGICRVHEGVGEAWMMVTKHAQGQSVAVVRSIRRHLEQFVNQLGLHRVQALVQEGFPHGEKFLKGLGFHFESTLERYMPDRRNAKLFVRLFQ